MDNDEIRTRNVTTVPRKLFGASGLRHTSFYVVGHGGSADGGRFNEPTVDRVL